MFLFIFESIGTQELILIGIVALIFLGPRRMPEMARKLGKIMSEFRNTTQEFRTTWEREVNFAEEEKALRSAFTDESESQPVARDNNILPPVDQPAAAHPEVREIDPSRFDAMAAASDTVASEQIPTAEERPEHSELEAKQNWL